MNNYPGLFRYLDEGETAEMQQHADKAFWEAEDELLIKAIFHPVWRIHVAKLIIESAEEEMKGLVRENVGSTHS